MEPSLMNVFEQQSLKWIFVGGKGGVGKTTCSASIAVEMAKRRETVLLLSTDPAHNLSDAFGQKFTSQPTKVNGIDNLFALEIDPNPVVDESLPEGKLFKIKGLMDIPGVDEVMSALHLMSFVKSLQFSVIVFDTAPTGHTLRLLNLPGTLEMWITKAISLSDSFSPYMSMFQQMAPMMGEMGAAMGNIDPQEMLAALPSIKAAVADVVEQFSNPDLCTFVCVCIPEFLSLYETERLVQELTKNDIDTHNIIINQLLLPEPGCTSRLLQARIRMQQKYLDQFDQLYGDDFNIIKLPLLEREVRGVPSLNQFSKMLVDPEIIAQQKHWELLPPE
jgi:arsenite-transporting ATPase